MKGNIMKSWWSLSLIAIILVFSSCTKKEGEGGTASITGSVRMKLVSDDFQTIHSEFPAHGQDVYIIYGDNDYYSDKTETLYDGTYQFGYLRKGKYRIYSYSDDVSGASESGEVAIMRDVEITKNGEVISAAEMEVYDQTSNYEGSSTIIGKLFAYDWNAEMTILKDTFYLRNEYVYIARRADDYYFERIRSFYDGSFVFPSLPIGEYEVYAYSRDASMQDPQDEIPVIISVDITENKQTVDIGRLEIIN